MKIQEVYSSDWIEGLLVYPDVAVNTHTLLNKKVVVNFSCLIPKEINEQTYLIPFRKEIEYKNYSHYAKHISIFTGIIEHEIKNIVDKFKLKVNSLKKENKTNPLVIYKIVK